MKITSQHNCTYKFPQQEETNSLKWTPEGIDSPHLNPGHSQSKRREKQNGNGMNEVCSFTWLFFARLINPY